MICNRYKLKRIDFKLPKHKSTRACLLPHYVSIELNITKCFFHAISSEMDNSFKAELVRYILLLIKRNTTPNYPWNSPIFCIKDAHFSNCRFHMSFNYRILQGEHFVLTVLTSKKKR